METVETVAPLKEIIDVIKESGGEAFKFCYQFEESRLALEDSERQETADNTIIKIKDITEIIQEVI